MSRDWDKERKAAKNMSIASCIYGIVFMVIWCAIAPSFMKLFGLGGLAMMIYRLYICIQLSKENKRKELPREIDPWERPAVSDTPRQNAAPTGDSRFCPYCGGAIQEEFVFCPKCGRQQP